MMRMHTLHVDRCRLLPAGRLRCFKPSGSPLDNLRRGGGRPAQYLVAYRHNVGVAEIPREAVVRIAADTKYWLWVNGDLVVFEGGLKRGPTPDDTYYDRVDLAPYLHRGENRIALLLWHFGKEGFSHRDSGRSGVIVASESRGFELASDSSWLCRIHPAYGTAGDPQPISGWPNRTSVSMPGRRWRLATADAAGTRRVPPGGRRRRLGRRSLEPSRGAAHSAMEGFRDRGGSVRTSCRRPCHGATALQYALTPVLTLTVRSGDVSSESPPHHAYAGGRGTCGRSM